TYSGYTVSSTSPECTYPSPQRETGALATRTVRTLSSASSRRWGWLQIQPNSRVMGCRFFRERRACGHGSGAGKRAADRTVNERRPGRVEGGRSSAEPVRSIEGPSDTRKRESTYRTAITVESSLREI